MIPLKTHEVRAAWYGGLTMRYSIRDIAFAPPGEVGYHPDKENGPIRFHNTLRKTVMEHRQKEARAGVEIWPAVPKVGREVE